MWAMAPPLRFSTRSARPNGHSPSKAQGRDGQRRRPPGVLAAADHVHHRPDPLRGRQVRKPRTTVFASKVAPWLRSGARGGVLLAATAKPVGGTPNQRTTSPTPVVPAKKAGGGLRIHASAVFHAGLSDEPCGPSRTRPGSPSKRACRRSCWCGIASLVQPERGVSAKLHPWPPWG
jgi:hypothetical protein